MNLGGITGFFNAILKVEQMSFWQSIQPPEDISTHGHKIDWLFNYITYANLFFFFIVCVALFGFSWYYREKKSDQPVIFTYGNSKKSKYAVLLIGAGVFIGIDTMITAFSNQDLINTFWNYPKKGEAYRVEAMGQQWMWTFRTPGNDKVFNTADDIVSNHELRIPVGEKIYIQMTSKDVIHSLFFPNVRLKTDAIPGRISRMWFDTLKTGTYPIACAEMCGTAHYRMQGKLIVMEKQAFEEWEKEASTLARDTIDRENATLFWGWKWEQMK